MSLVLSAVLMILQTELIAPECQVQYCDNASCNGISCTQCLPGYYSYVTDQCYRCYLYCQLCENGECYARVSIECQGFLPYLNCSSAGCSAVVSCSSCPDGFYFNIGRCFQCHNPNCKCTTLNGCDGCLHGYYGTSNFCIAQCPSNCTSCISGGYCTKCTHGKYNRTCQLDCLNTCNDESCDIDSGTCTSACLSNQYLEADGKCHMCYPRCSTCTGYDNCTSCKQIYYWGKRCMFDCIGCYAYCNRNDGCSSGCDDLYYQSYSPEKEGYDCIRCPETCSNCNGSSTCTSCKQGYWGSHCQFNCDGCGGACNKDTGCGGNCLTGYYSVYEESGYECKTCPDRCESCIDSTTCSICEEGYFVDQAYRCADCPIKCKYNACSRTNGTCKSGCHPGFAGLRCDLDCSDNCMLCNQFNSSDCYSCKSSFYGDSCEKKCSLKCETQNGSIECGKTDGFCKNGCVAGYWSKNCSIACPEVCLDHICNETNGDCLESTQLYLTTARHSSSMVNVIQTGRTSTIGFAVAFGVMLLVAGVSFVFNIRLYRRRIYPQISKDQKQNIICTKDDVRKTGSSHQPENSLSTPGQSLEGNDYQNLNRTLQDERTYTSITQDYENNF